MAAHGSGIKRGRPVNRTAPISRPVAPGRSELKVRNAPLFPGPTDLNEGGAGKAQWEEPLLGPEESNPKTGDDGKLTNLETLHQAMNGRDPQVNEVPHPAPISDADFPGSEDCSAGTRRVIRPHEPDRGFK